MLPRGDSMNTIERELAKAEQRYRIACVVSRGVERSILLLLMAALLLVGASLADLFGFVRQGQSPGFPGFDALREINPDVCAWLRLEGTHIDHPVVRGKDNFCYLDKAFDGRFYAGGAIFLDCRNSKDMRDPYNIIHGHYMEGGAMFGDLGRYLEEVFFQSHSRGELLTPSGDYELLVMGVAVADAYDEKIYYPPYSGGGKIPLKELCRRARYLRKEGRQPRAGDGKPRAGDELLVTESMKKGQLLALSTCSGAMDQSRIVVFCRMTKKESRERRRWEHESIE